MSLYNEIIFSTSRQSVKKKKTIRQKKRTNIISGGIKSSPVDNILLFPKVGLEPEGLVLVLSTENQIYLDKMFILLRNIILLS